MIGTRQESRPFSLYIHIPYCGQRCPYCDFNTYVEAKIPEEEYTSALLSELRYRSRLPAWKGRPLQSIFFGGGTPSLFKAKSLGSVISAAKELFSPEPTLEVTIEANPGTVSLEYFGELRQHGIERISLGAQSFNRGSLRELGRAHSVEETLAAYNDARTGGFKNINLDLIYALPKQGLGEFKADLETLCDLAPEHISAYQLTIEKGTPFSFRYHQGDLILPPEDDTIAMMEHLVTYLAQRGFEQYEISNFAKPEKRCRHNQAYWDGDDYLGLGAGAHSFSSIEGEGFGRRWSNFALPVQYMQRVGDSGEGESWRDTLSKTARQFEFFFLGLRRSAGVSIADFSTRFKEDLLSVYGNTVETLQEQGLLCKEGDLIFLSERGRLLADSVFQEFVRDE